MKTKMRADQYTNDFFWDKSTSEPDLSENNPQIERWSTKYPFEYISVDELKFFRRRKPTDFHTRSSICLFDKDEPVLPFSSLKTEYTRRFKNPISFLRQKLTRRSTSLKLEGQMEIESEHKSKYLHYPEAELLKCRRSPTRNPENLALSGDLHLTPEYTSAFVNHTLPDQTKKVLSKEAIQIERVFDLQNGNKNNLSHKKTITKTSVKYEPTKCHLKLEGEMTYVPEYRSQYIEFPIERSHSIPQLSNIKFQGNFVSIPEYRENFKFYDNYSKSAPIKKEDHINFHGDFEGIAEYKKEFKQPEKSAIDKAILQKTEDHLETKSEFTKNVPEYLESFKDPKITQKPEKSKCREPYFRLKGKIEFNPEYRSTYLDHPRARPITKKGTSSIRLSNSAHRQSRSPSRKFHPDPNTKYHDPNIDILPLNCQPEYRKARREFMIRERPLARKITELDYAPKTITKTYSEAESVELQTKNTTTAKGRKRTPRKHGQHAHFKLGNENIIEVNENYQKSSPKFGRRASISRNARNSRIKTTIIEGNSKYIKKSQDYNKQGYDPSFVVLDEPSKPGGWMKKTWYDA